MLKTWWKKGNNSKMGYGINFKIAVKIYLPCNFEVNSITYFGVITLFSSNFQHFSTFRPLFQKLLKINVKLNLLQNCRVGRSWHVAHFCNLNLTSISYSCWNIRGKVLKCWKFDEKREIIPKWEMCLPCNFEVNPVTHFGVISLFSSNFQHFNTFRPLFWNLLQNCRVGRSWHVAHFCNIYLTSISSSFWNNGRKVLKCWKFDEKREITPKWVTGFTSKLHGKI
jgi:hypothetical protein